MDTVISFFACRLAAWSKPIKSFALFATYIGASILLGVVISRFFGEFLGVIVASYLALSLPYHIKSFPNVVDSLKKKIIEINEAEKENATQNENDDK